MKKKNIDYTQGTYLKGIPEDDEFTIIVLGPETPFAPLNTVAPVVSGILEFGHVLTCSSGTWRNSPTHYNYQWKRGDEDIPFVMVDNYMLGADDVGQMMSCQVTAINDGGSAHAMSNSVGPVERPMTPPWEPPAWLIRDTALYPVPSTPRPDYLKTIIDPTFVSKVTRISGDPGTVIPNGGGATWGDICRQHFSTTQAWNCDQSLMYLENRGAGATGSGGLFLNGQTYEVAFMRPTVWPPDSDVRWHPTDPELMDFARTSTFGFVNVRTGWVPFLKDFGSGYSNMRIGYNRGNRSFDGRMVALTARINSRDVIIPYDILNDVRHPDIFTDAIPPAGRAMSSCFMSPSGEYILVNYSGDLYDLIDLDGNLLGTLPQYAAALGDVAYDNNRDEVWVGRLNSGSIGMGPSGTISKFRFRDGFRTQLTSGGYVYYTGIRAQAAAYQLRDRARWASGDTRNQNPYVSEILLIGLSGNVVFRLCHHQNVNTQSGDAVTQPSMSPDGNRIVFASAWTGGAGGDRPIGAYVVDCREAPPPINRVAPILEGEPDVGHTLLCLTGEWYPDPDDYSYQWFRGDEAVGRSSEAESSEDNSATYVITADDVGQVISCQVTASNESGSSTAMSDEVGPIEKPPSVPDAPVNTTAPVISGTPQVGQTLTSTPGQWSNDPTVFENHWWRGTGQIEGATAGGYTLTAADLGANIRCEVTASNAGGSTAAFSNSLGPVVAEPVEPPPTSWEPPRWVITDRVVRPIPSVPRPAYLVPFTDPNFGAPVTRITGDPGTPIPNVGGTWGDCCRHHYINSQAWNCDQTLIYLEPNKGVGASGSGSLWLDGETYQPRHVRGSGWPSGADTRWHPTDPSLMDFARTNTFGYYNVRTGAQQIVRNFGTEFSDMRIGHNKGNRSFDGNMVVLTAVRAGLKVVIPYRIDTDTVLGVIDPGVVHTRSAFSSAWAAPSGNRIIWNFSPDNYFYTELDGSIVTELPINYCSHGDCCYDAQREDVLVGRVNSSSLGFGPGGTVNKWRLRDGQRTQLSTGGYTTHTSARAQKAGQGGDRARWCVGAAMDYRTGSNPQHPPYTGEILMMALTGSTVYRLCNHQSTNEPDYDAYVMAVPSPDNGRVLFASTWRAPGNPARPIGTYVVDIRK